MASVCSCIRKERAAGAGAPTVNGEGSNAGLQDEALRRVSSHQPMKLITGLRGPRCFRLHFQAGCTLKMLLGGFSDEIQGQL